jgi:hypothetical protein
MIKRSRYSFIVLAAVAASYVLTNEFLAAAGMALICAAWAWMPRADGPPVIAIALSFHIMQIIAGYFYEPWSQSVLMPYAARELPTMVQISLTGAGAMMLGLFIGAHPQWFSARRHPSAAVPLKLLTLLMVYLAFVVGSDVLRRVASDTPALTQPLYALLYLRLGVLYLVLRRLIAAGQWLVAGGLLAVEVIVGATGFFSAFKEPLLIGVIALSEQFDMRRTGHWVAGGLLAVAVILGGVLWIGIRGDLRADLRAGVEATTLQRVQRLVDLSARWFDSDRWEQRTTLDVLIERLWDVYYPALALERVPAVVPHQDGRLLNAALQHIFAPRVLFPNKPPLPNESENVRRFSGIRVAGEESGTTIAFGYTIESYIDFGRPMMYLPIFCYGLAMGVGFGALRRTIKNTELATVALTTIFLMSLHGYNQAWARMIGNSLTLVVYVGGIVVLADWFLRQSRQAANVSVVANPHHPV